MHIAQFLLVLRARWKVALAVFLITVVSTIVVSLSIPKKYAATASVVIDVKPDPIGGAIYSAMMGPALMATQVDVMQSDRVALKVVRNLKLAENPQIREQFLAGSNGIGTIEQWLSELFQQNLEVKPARESNVINVTYKAADPRFAAAIANAFVQAYIETSVELRVDPARQYSAFFEQRAKESREKLEKAQAALSNFQSEKGVIINDDRLDVENNRLNELSSQLVMLQALAAESGSRQTQATGASADRMQEVLSNPLLGSMKADLNRAEARLQELNAKLGDRHPQVIEAKASISDIRSAIEAETKRVTGGVSISNKINLQRETEVRASLEAQRAKLLRLKGVRDEGSVLLRDVENAQRAYEQVLARLNQSNLESQTTQTNVAILNPASPPNAAASPKPLLNALLSVFVGSLLGLGIILLLEMMNRLVRSPEDVSEILGLPVLGVVPSPASKRMFGLKAIGTQMEQRILGQLPMSGKGA
ncbi:chain length determinant protein EpsF [Roseateles albus]|uniref:Chain length determinant protein EpsF n=1 Tax=Roseateles albus TaxID=2987525 RepID=A0ABT5KDS1_9BURK|nr:chain length determinant protein EpsF [Roseateles albus]MDC8772070.1 chain length determinant protein EpsF [Roseateles albus]